MSTEDDPFAVPASDEAETAQAEASSQGEFPAPAEDAHSDAADAPSAAKGEVEQHEEMALDTAHADGSDADEEEPLQDLPADPEALSVAPPRLHSALVDQLSLRWHEVKEFVSRLEGVTGDRELDDVLGCARHYLKA